VGITVTRYISAICLIVLNATAAGPLKAPEEFVWSQAFWYGTWAAILYFIVATLMVVTVYGAYSGHYDNDFMLTMSQRTLMLQTIMFLMYLLIGALVFARIEDWNYLDAVYWANVTLFTVGFGDFVVKTTLGRALLIPYALVGVISLGLVIGSIRTLVLDRGRRRLDARMIEKKRRRMVRAMTVRGNDEILKPIQGDGQPSPGLPHTELERRREEFNLMRKIQHSAQRRRRWVAMAVSTSSWVALWLIGAKIFQEAEAPYQQWDYFEGFYFAFVTLTTIGYGDRTPVSNCGKSFFVFWSLLALPTMTVLISNAGDTVVKGIRDATIQLGNITILPGERGFRKDVKAVLRSISFGVLFSKDEEVEELAPGFLGESQPTGPRGSDSSDGDEDVDFEDGELENAEEGSSQNRGSQTNAERPSRLIDRNNTGDTTASTRIQRSLSITRDPRTSLPESRFDYQYLLICEIHAVTQHMKMSPPRRYTYAEWAWYLKLIGEDESSAETHRKANPHVHDKVLNKKNRGAAGGDADTPPEVESKNAETAQWSWVGSRSPLMGSQEESEWILERLTERLRDELAASRREEIEHGRGIHRDGRGDETQGDRHNEKSGNDDNEERGNDQSK
jgi:potassium channel subfamily K, other eukaryote